MEIALSKYSITFDMMKGGTSQNLFITFGFVWKLWRKMSTFPYDQCSILPARLAKECTRSHLF